MEQVTVETLKLIADQLIQAREARNMSLDEIATKTFIPLRILKALEAGDPYKLPEPVFVQGFIKRYADLVGLDGSTLSRELTIAPTPAPTPIEHPVTTSPTPESSIEQGASVVDRSPVDRSPVDRSPSPVTAAQPHSPTPQAIPSPRETAIKPELLSPSRDRSRDRPAWFWPTIGGIGALLVLLGAIARMPRQSNQPTNQAVPSTPPATQPKSPAPIANPPQPASPVTIAVNLSDASWLEVIADGKVIFEGELQKGATQTWSANREIEISSGNAGAVSVVHNQQPPVVMGQLGQVKTLKFSATR